MSATSTAYEAGRLACLDGMFRVLCCPSSPEAEREWLRGFDEALPKYYAECEAWWESLTPLARRRRLEALRVFIPTIEAAYRSFCLSRAEKRRAAFQRAARKAVKALRVPQGTGAAS